MQSRGTQHFHAAVHVKDAPQIDRELDEEVISFIDKYISCALPDVDSDPELHDLITKRQVHHHTRTCKKKQVLHVGSTILGRHQRKQLYHNHQ